VQVTFHRWRDGVLPNFRPGSSQACRKFSGCFPASAIYPRPQGPPAPNNSEASVQTATITTFGETLPRAKPTAISSCSLLLPCHKGGFFLLFFESFNTITLFSGQIPSQQWAVINGLSGTMVLLLLQRWRNSTFFRFPPPL